MAISSRSNQFISSSNISRLQVLYSNIQRFAHTLAADAETARLEKKAGLDSRSNPSTSNNDVDFHMSSWRAVDSRSFGIHRGKVSVSTLMTLNHLHKRGKKAYLVGGCVRDLLLNRIPKDYDVIADAELQEIKRCFARAHIVGQRFPICLVYLKGSIIEVSSFHTVARDDDGKEKVSDFQEPIGCKTEDSARWQNCLHRDFTINSLFYDPRADKIYDYANGLRDLKLRKVQTVIPAHLSFKEDCARILRGIRIAARLGFSFSAETATAIHDLHLSILDLHKVRLMLEMDYMFSYGAAKSSLLLLKRFNILDLVLPFHGAYLSEQRNQSFPMLFKLFSSMDSFFACGRPCNAVIWIGVLAFHHALVHNPQEALVIFAFSYVLQHQCTWKEAIKFAREKSQRHVQFSPEILDSCSTKEDKALEEDINRFVSQVISSINNLVEEEGLVKSMKKYPRHPCSGLVFISKAKGAAAAKFFGTMLNKKESSSETIRKNLEINYKLIKEGDFKEMGYVVGKIILDTITNGDIQDQQLEKSPKENKDENNSTLSSLFGQGDEMVKKKNGTRKWQFVNEDNQSPVGNQKGNKKASKKTTTLSSLF